MTVAQPFDTVLPPCRQSLGEERRLAPLDLSDEHRLNDGKCDPSGRLRVGTNQYGDISI